MHLGTNLEIIVTATLFGIDIYVATDSYRPGKPLWLKYCPNAMATRQLQQSSTRDLTSTFPTSGVLQQKQWLELTHVNSCHFDAIKPASSIQLSRPFLEASNSTDTVEL